MRSIVLVLVLFVAVPAFAGRGGGSMGGRSGFSSGSSRGSSFRSSRSSSGFKSSGAASTGTRSSGSSSTRSGFRTLGSVGTVHHYSTSGRAVYRTPVQRDVVIYHGDSTGSFVNGMVLGYVLRGGRQVPVYSDGSGGQYVEDEDAEDAPTAPVIQFETPTVVDPLAEGFWPTYEWQRLYLPAEEPDRSVWIVPVVLCFAALVAVVAVRRTR